MIKATMRKSGSAAPVVDTTAEVVETKTTPAHAGAAKAPTTVEATADPALENMLAEADKADTGATAPKASTTALTRRSNNTVVATASSANSLAGDGFEGDWGTDDLKYPQLKQVQGSGPLSQEYDNGTIILGEAELLPAPSVKEGAKNTPLRFVPVVIQKQFREKLGQEAIDNGEMPRIFNSIAEVEENGLTTQWVGNTMPDNYAEASAKCLFIVEKPEGVDHPSFVHNFDGKDYAIAVYYAAGGAFRESAKVIFNTAKTSLLVPVLKPGTNEVLKNDKGVVMKRPLLHKQFWTMGFRKVTVGNFTPWRPQVRLLKEETGPELRAYIESVLTAPAVAAAAEND